ncbi:MAG: hypothetical protein SCM11_06560 [Bacillota bacterium]|nr:hypothetical protein [Bacillota bacterium]
MGKRKTRKESFFGVHFDFHADPRDNQATPVGERTTTSEIDAIIDKLTPDYIQCDCKGHPGWSSYPTVTGLPYPRIEGDPLRTWRESTARRSTALYLHYSGVIDREACRHHPDWACLSADGTSDAKATSTFGPYVDRWLIPQLIELAGTYGVDGIWIDGDCWGVKPDFNPDVLELFKAETGIDLTLYASINPEETYYDVYRSFCRESFRRYLRHTVDTLHHLYPGFQIASNWAFSSHMPEAVSADVDFLSGDYSPQDAVNSARFEGRILAGQGMAWDLMAWGFSVDVPNNGFFPKSTVQLMQEAAAVISLGGGFQCYLTQRKDGSIRQNQVDNLAGVARFCRERQSWCHQASIVPQAVLLYSTTDHYKTSSHLFHNDQTDSIRGMTQLMCQSQLSFEIRSEHNMHGLMYLWPLIVVPELSCLEESFKTELLDYVRQGGNLLLAGCSTASVFADKIGLSLSQHTHAYTYVSSNGKQWAAVKGPSAILSGPSGCMPYGLYSPDQDGDRFQSSAGLVIPFGKGRIACFPIDLGSSFKVCKAAEIRNLFINCVQKLYHPMVQVSGSQYVDMIILQKDDDYLIQLVNTSGPHDNPNWRSVDEITPVGPLSIEITLPAAPSSVILYPVGQPVAGKWESGCFRFVLDRLDIHSIIAIRRG